jgi:hypothetical protein
MYTLQTVQADVRETTGRTLLFEYLMDNTWTYEATIEPLGSTPDVRPLAGCLLLFWVYK